MSHSSLSKPAPSSCIKQPVESDGWPPPQLHAALASTPIYHKRRLIQDRTHIVTQNHLLLKCFSCLIPDSWPSLSLFFFPFILLSFLSWFFFFLRDVSWEMLFASAQIIQEVGKGTRDRRERASLVECKGNFFFPRPTIIPIKSYYLPLALQHCGIEWSKEETSSSRVHIIGW